MPQAQTNNNFEFHARLSNSLFFQVAFQHQYLSACHTSKVWSGTRSNRYRIAWHHLARRCKTGWYIGIHRMPAAAPWCKSNRFSPIIKASSQAAACNINNCRCSDWFGFISYTSSPKWEQRSQHFPTRRATISISPSLTYNSWRQRDAGRAQWRA